MDRNELLRLKGFYENELTNRILAFWLPRCEDREYGGYVNCFDNAGEKLQSYDKYTWSQGRFVWVFSRLAVTKAGIFSRKQRQEFLRLAKTGRDFLIRHCLMGPEDWRCVYLMERDGSPRHVEGWEPLDMSIYADCFVVLAMAGYGAAAGDREAYAFGKRLYESILERVKSGTYNTLPYPLSERYRAHGIPMILSNVTKELYEAAALLEPDSGYCIALRERLGGFTDDILNHFADERNVIHEVIAADNRPVEGILGQHANPGHTIEDMWFMMEAADLLGREELVPRIAGITAQALEIGWDREFGGILHYSAVTGGPPVGAEELSAEMELVKADVPPVGTEELSAEMEPVKAGGPLVGTEEMSAEMKPVKADVPPDGAASPIEPVERQVWEGWGDKLWWVHSEALYTTLLCYHRTGEARFLEWHEKVFSYTFRTFPNRDSEVREWKQICKRDGSPQDKVVALPVKDPFHITRNLILILELLETMMEMD